MSAHKPKIRMVVAYAANRCIGKDNSMPWHLPSDLAHFKRVTLGHPIIMGRKTWESLGRPLPGRLNLVVSRDPGYLAQGATVYSSVDDALQACSDSGTEICCIIGGQQIFALGLPIADEIYATEIHAEIEGDTFFPALAAELWTESARQPQAEENGYRYDFVVYQRKAPHT
ncbi:dihydrofolate reductase [Paenalcaligenes niemegkensis]|uniref:dihydrofolate reductase n=1 Tax=Paenalcaligenes niemegkensis TaxID=2895469 RepID=UPI001EE81D89|nr:dihydrofolate reductase [Paenalcaligenes niemegkensis]MCQ9617266.1 dihydrofolate reductase [Paenalcaligenes niemegkensis]